jgi:pimeloyl-ACP methyl ester carboxylesterase
MKLKWRLFILYLLVLINFSLISTLDNNISDLLHKKKTKTKEISCETVTFYVPKNHRGNELIKRTGTLIVQPNAIATVLVCHGFLCTNKDVGFFRKSLFGSHFNTMTFDFRAHGDHVGDDQVSTFGYDESLDVIAAMQWLKKHPSIKEKPIFVYGFSMGAVAAIQAQGKEKLFDAMVLDCPFDTSQAIVRRGLDFVKIPFTNIDVPGKNFLAENAFNPYVQSFITTLFKVAAHWDSKHIPISLVDFSPVESMTKIDVPCFFIHCKEDKKIPLSSMYHLYAKKNGYKRLWITDGRKHFDSFFYDPEKYIYKVRRFFMKVVQNELDKKLPHKVVYDVGVS